ncbi:MAG: aminoacyl-tRNA hydrolase [Bacteroidia bacterium]|nr:aminoacyl-tRNA hydrolase [Bacteroidia bacterium]NNF30435.1 aminoacyl-tRNA hydrolase [Flavobacteriaceae bacterium]MBT8275664.1 aminoacyl-tRNA hydrolase [Bacteroidia bacterium]NNJ82662.1 aminoacyl-tRNA hydrolase [Flavobacteriaceae bacterium]NNK54307.1 aminoacyl-tRNA hydrolase [Flavobacteriaceae bacterium]
MESEQVIKELRFKAIRSSGPGGQHVNKSSSKIEVQFNIENSEAFSEKERERLRDRLAKRITSDGLIILQCGETRSQHRNKAIVVQRLLDLLAQNLKVKKKRKKTKPSKTAIEKRLKVKKQQALKKSSRRPPKIE